MKHKIWIVAAAVAFLFTLIISLRTASSQNSREEKRAQRAEARQERYARETRYIEIGRASCRERV